MLEILEIIIIGLAAAVVELGVDLKVERQSLVLEMVGKVEVVEDLYPTLMVEDLLYSLVEVVLVEYMLAVMVLLDLKIEVVMVEWVPVAVVVEMDNRLLEDLHHQ